MAVTAETKLDVQRVRADFPYLEQRLNTYGNNDDVKSELKKAQKAAKGGD